MKRITVIMSDETFDKVIEQGKTEGRKKSPMAAMLIELGLPKTGFNLSYQEEVAAALVKKRKG